MFFGSYETNKNNKMNDTLNDSSNETLLVLVKKAGQSWQEVLALSKVVKSVGWREALPTVLFALKRIGVNAFLHSSIEEEVSANRLVPSSYFDSFRDGIRSNRESA